MYHFEYFNISQPCNLMSNVKNKRENVCGPNTFKCSRNCVSVKSM